MEKFEKALMGGIMGTAAISVAGRLAAQTGFPPMNIPEMISAMLKIAPIAGWAIHFILGFTLACGYVYLLNEKLPVRSNVGRGVIYGIVLFIISLFLVPVVGTRFHLSPAFGNMSLVLLESLAAHIIYGAVVGAVAGHRVMVHEDSDVADMHQVPDRHRHHFHP